MTLSDGQVRPKPPRQLMEDRLAFLKFATWSKVRCTVSGTHRGQRHGRCNTTCLTGTTNRPAFTAMERTTAFPASLVAYMQARRLPRPMRLLELCLPTEQHGRIGSARHPCGRAGHRGLKPASPLEPQAADNTNGSQFCAQ